MTNHCIICDSEKYDILYSGILQCENCRYVYADTKLSQDEFEEIYNSGYFTGEEYSDYLSDKYVLQKNFSGRLNTLSKYIKIDKHKTLLEIGSAYGFFLELAAKKFNNAVGIDITKEGVEHARDKLGLNVFCDDLLKWDFNNRKYDIVCLWDTIEHLKRPDEYLKNIRVNMTDGGILALTTPDIGSLVARFRKKNWRMIHPPTHAHYFSKDSMTRILDRYGYDIIHFEHCGFYRSIETVSYILFVLKTNLSWIHKIITILGVGKIGFYTNLYDQMYVIARRR